MKQAQPTTAQKVDTVDQALQLIRYVNGDLNKFNQKERDEWFRIPLLARMAAYDTWKKVYEGGEFE